MSRRKRTSWIPTGRCIKGSLRSGSRHDCNQVAQQPGCCLSALELLCELDSVAVRVVDVEQAHLALQLEDDAYVDAFRAQAVGLGLQVRHVDVRDGALFLGVALG